MSDTMGRNRKDRKSAQADDYKNNDTTSTKSTVSSSDFGGAPKTKDVGVDESTLVDQFVEALYQNRASIREAGLKGLIDAFTSSVLTKFAEDQSETLSNRIINSVKVGSGPEAAQGACALGLLAFTVGAGDSAKTILSDATPHLWKVVRVGPSVVARCSALEALGVLAFIGAVDLESTEAILGLLWSIISHKRSPEDQKTGINLPPSEVKVSAIAAWAFVLSTVISPRVSSSHLQSSLPILSDLLKNDDPGVRIAAGEALALICELIDTSEFVEPIAVDSAAAEVPPISNVNVARATIPEDLVAQQMKALSMHASGKGQPKKERAMQRNSFRELLASIKKGVAPQVSVKLPAGNTLKFKSWTAITQLNFVRRFLGEGFQTHMQRNELLHDIFDFVPQAEKHKSPLTKDKRSRQSPNSVVSKACTQLMNHRRQNSQSQKMGRVRRKPP